MEVEEKNFLDGDSGVTSRVRRGFLSLRVVLQMLSWPHKSHNHGDDMLHPLIWLPASVTQRHSGVGKVMWVMQQLERRAGALDVDLISNQPEGMTLISSSAHDTERTFIYAEMVRCDQKEYYMYILFILLFQSLFLILDRRYV